eukprot:350934-Chlamydomonas_euryale.AAC.1
MPTPWQAQEAVTVLATLALPDTITSTSAAAESQLLQRAPQSWPSGQQSPGTALPGYSTSPVLAAH